MDGEVADGGKAAAPVHKGFVQVGERFVHYVRQGAGPALVMLHAAPCSAKVMEPLQSKWSPYFTTFAFDLPGFGLSDAPAADPVETHHLADTIVAAIRALGMELVTLYGRHTGAGVAVEIARRHPELCAFVLTDGYPVFANPYDDRRLAEYLTPITPTWDGSHLTWSWFRYREQHTFWPWDRPSLATRADTDIPGLDFLYRGMIELIEAHATYASVYASAFRHPGLAVIDEVKVPICFGNRPGDSQYKTVKLYPPSAWVQVFPRDGELAADLELQILREHGKGTIPRPHHSRVAERPSALRDYLPTPLGPVYARGCGLDRPGVPMLFLPDLPGGSDLHMDEILRFGMNRPVLAFDFIGNGNTTAPVGHKPSIGKYVEQVREVMQALGWERVYLYARGTSAAVAVEFAQRHPSLVERVVFRSPPAIETNRTFAASYAPDIEPEWSGGNFLKLWHHLRDQELWWPWYERTIHNARTSEPRIEPSDLHRRAVVLLRQPAHYRPIWAAVLGYDLVARLTTLDLPRVVVTEPKDIFAFAAPGAAERMGLEAPIDLSHPHAIVRLEDWLG